MERARIDAQHGLLNDQHGLLNEPMREARAGPHAFRDASGAPDPVDRVWEPAFTGFMAEVRG